jgi:hypothetical protein
MVAIGVVILAAGLPQICYEPFFAKFKFESITTLSYVIAQEIRAIPD